MGVFPGHGANLPTQLWIVGRGMEAVSLLLAPAFLDRRVRAWPALLCWAGVTGALLALVFPLGLFPTCYVEEGPNPGLTGFKIGAEYVICAVLLGSLALIWRRRERFSPRSLELLMSAVAATIFSEIAFTQYVSVYGDFNVAGHLLKAVSFLLIFKAVVEGTLRDPYQELFRDLQQQRQRLAEANRAKDEFLATLSHELRSPLNAIVGWSQLLLHGSLDQGRTRHAYEVIDRSAKAQTALIADVLDVSRIISGKLRLNLAAVEVTDAVQAALDTVRPAAEARRIQVRTAAMDHVTVQGDPDRLQQVFWNLLSNAVKFTPEGGTVVVDVSRRDDRVEITVRDTGAGLSPEALAHLFERFWQADASASRRHSGLGLGLAIVRHLVELHGGQVRAASEGAGRGSVFTVAIPAAAPSDDREEPARPEGAKGEAEGGAGAASDPARSGISLSGLRVLLVEDQADARAVLTAALRAYGAEAEAAASAREGLQKVRAWRPHLVLSDIGMPTEDGYAFIRQLRELPPDAGGRTPAVALTAYGRPEDREKALAAGYREHLIKPVTPGVLAAVVLAECKECRTQTPECRVQTPDLLRGPA
ncbi:MAG: response regulator, partial [Acidobacteria bacterium]